MTLKDAAEVREARLPLHLINRLEKGVEGESYDTALYKAGHGKTLGA